MDKNQPITTLLYNYSYRFPKGYPDLTDSQDIMLLESIINEIIPNKINLQEMVQLSPSQLLKPFHSDNEHFGKYKYRGERFLEKIQKGEPLETINGGSVIIDKNKSKEAINYLKSREYNKLGGINKLFVDTKGHLYSLSNFTKTKEFGAGGGKGQGHEQTNAQESTQCLFNALSYKLFKGKLSKEDITKANFDKVKQYVFAFTPYEEMLNFALTKTNWTYSMISTANLLYKTYKNNNFEFHHGSEFVKKIMSAFDKCKKHESISLQKDKWNPADIWLVDKTALSTKFKETFDELNEQIRDLYDSKDLIGVSLKMVGSNPSISVQNDGEEEKHEVKYEGFKSTVKSKMCTLVYSGGQIYLRSFMFADAFAGEIEGRTAVHGKIGMNALSKFIKDIGELPPQSTKEVRKRIYDEDPKFETELWNLYKQYVEPNISKLKFKEYFDEQNEDWKYSKYLSLFVVNVMEKAPKDKVDELMNNIIGYSSSTSKISSVFVKVS